MTCRDLERYDQGKMDEAEFIRHAAGCRTCREALRLDKRVMSLSQSLRQPIDAPDLWNRIEDSLQKEITGVESPAPEFRVKRGHWRIWRLAAVSAALIMVACIGIFIGVKIRTSPSGLLSEKALARVEQKEQEYLQAILNLEKIVLPQLGDLNLELNFLYRDRLETIDAQIQQLREALEFNTANVHMRRHLMMALQEKKETLGEVMNLRY